MRKLLLSFVLLQSVISYSQHSPYERAWQALNANRRTEAAGLFAEAEKDPQYSADAYISKIYLASYNGKESTIEDFEKSFYAVAENPGPYVYALWFNKAVLGEYGKKIYDRQVKLMDRIIGDKKAHGTLIAAANYQRGIHSLYSNELPKAAQYFKAVGSIGNWQFAGPFENISQSGFYKNYGPPDHPGPGAVFKSMVNADVKWIIPPAECKEGWTPVSNQYHTQTAVVYAQNFVHSPVDQTVLCNVGASGSVKVWINDVLIVAEARERVTEMDVYTVEYHLKKGVNRVLVQLGFTQSTYPNFCIRFTDEKFRPIESVTGSSVYADYPKEVSGISKRALLPHFAEKYFQEKIAVQPRNIVNYLLLSDVYLRNEKIPEVRNLLIEAMKMAPENCLLKMKMLEVLIKEGNRTLLLEELEKLKQADPESLMVLDMNIKEFIENQKYEDAAAELTKRILLHGEDINTASYHIQLLASEKKYEKLMQEAEIFFSKYPVNAPFLEAMYIIKKDVHNDIRAAMGVYENFMKNNYNYEVYTKYASLLADQGNFEKALEIKKKMTRMFPYSPEVFYSLSNYYYSTNQYDSAEVYIDRALALSPYHEVYWEKKGDINTEKHNKKAALEAYSQSVKYDPNQYTIFSKMRKLNGKPELIKLFPDTDIARIVSEDKPGEAQNTDYGYYYILDQKDVIIYPGGAREEYFTTIIRITNEKGVDRYKELSIDYGSQQHLLVEKAEVIKKNKARIEGERNDNEIVFTNLEVGDAVVLKYRLQSYEYGRFGREFWDRHYFNGQIYSAAVKYTLLLPDEEKIYFSFHNSDVKPVIKKMENFTQYCWEVLKAEPEKDEPLMPVLADVAPVLHISTIPSWKEIADWYSDVCSNKAEEDFEVIALYEKLFPGGVQQLSESRRAKTIYEYIQANIRYSSVSFRQSAYVPQRAAKTIGTRLGDCKDLSSLYVTLLQMAGIKAQMVLVNTRDNGEKQLMLPSMEFNHCIVKAVLDDKEYYIEMTDNYLPFASLPNNLLGATMLEIPSRNLPGKPELQFLKTHHRKPDQIVRIVDIIPAASDLNIQVKTVLTGALTSGTRSEYVSLDEEKQRQTMEKVVAGRYRNIVKLDKIRFNGLEKLDDSLTYTYSFKVKNEISEIGSLKTFRMVYPDIVASMEHFTDETRHYPIEYCDYENADSYETVVTVTAPAGSTFVELPASESFAFKDMQFSIQYALNAPDRLVVIRKFSNGRNNIKASDYHAFKSFFEKIVKAEQKFISFK